MARIRSIKPEFPQSESLGRLSRDARLLFVLLWPICDDHGRTRAAPRMLASLLFPYDDDAPGLIGAWLDELEHADCIRRYEVDGCSYLHIPKWLIHQKIDKPSKPLHPNPPETLAKPREDSSEEGKGRDQGKDQGKEISTTSQETPPASPGLLTLVSDNTKTKHAPKAEPEHDKASKEEPIVDLVLRQYHEFLPSCRKVAVKNPKLRRKILAADKLAGQTIREQGLKVNREQFWEAFFGECQDDPWLRGDAPNPNNPAWKQNLEVLLKEERFAEIVNRAIARPREDAA